MKYSDILISDEIEGISPFFSYLLLIFDNAIERKYEIPQLTSYQNKLYLDNQFAVEYLSLSAPASK